MDMAISGFSPPSPQQMFSKIDANGDGKLSVDEIEAGKPDRSGKAGGPNRPDANEILSKMDQDGDGFLSAAEFEAGAANRAGRASGGPGAMMAQESAQGGSSVDLLQALLETISSITEGNKAEDAQSISLTV